MSDDCIFCKIIRGELPSTRIYEDDNVLAFLDIAPVRPGHTLLIPKRHVETLFDLTEEQAAVLAAVMPKLASAIVKGVGAEGLNVFQANRPCAGQVVFHVHFHLVPRNEGDGVKFLPPQSRYGEGEMERVSEAIRAALR